jgi:hypothetical protein
MVTDPGLDDRRSAFSDDPVNLAFFDRLPRQMAALAVGCAPERMVVVKMSGANALHLARLLESKRRVVILHVASDQPFSRIVAAGLTLMLAASVLDLTGAVLRAVTP